MKDNPFRILRIINQYSNLKGKYEEIQKDEVRRQQSYFFAVTSIIQSLLAVGVGIAGAWMLTLTAESLLFIFTIVIGIALMLGALGLFIWALIRIIFQFKLNQKWWSWLSLLFFLASLAGILFGCFYFLNL